MDQKKKKSPPSKKKKSRPQDPPEEKKLKPAEEETLKKPAAEKPQDQEKKPKFRDLLSRSKKDLSSRPGSIGVDPADADILEEVDENILDVCGEIISVPFEIWHNYNKKVDPLSPAELKHISKPLARIVVKYDVAKYMKDELLLFTFLGFAIFKRSKVEKDDKNDNRKTGEGKNHPNETIDP